MPQLTKQLPLKEAIFITAWLGNDCNATKAYQQLHPDVSYASARVLGSRLLTKVNIPELMAEHGLGVEAYLKLFKRGLGATKTLGIQQNGKPLVVPDNEIREKYHRRLGKLLGRE